MAAPLNTLAKYVEKLIIYVLIVMMAIVLILATLELGRFLLRTILESKTLLIDLDALMDLFGLFLLVLIGIELLDTIKVYLREHVVHVEVVVLVAIIAVARKIVVLKIEELPGLSIIGIGLLLVSLAVAYHLIKRAGLLSCDMKRLDPEVGRSSAPLGGSEEASEGGPPWPGGGGNR